MAKNTLPEADNTWKESEGIDETMVPVEIQPSEDDGSVKMTRGTVTVHVAPQDIAAFISAGYQLT